MDEKTKKKHISRIEATIQLLMGVFLGLFLIKGFGVNGVSWFVIFSPLLLLLGVIAVLIGVIIVLSLFIILRGVWSMIRTPLFSKKEETK